ncbi:hypothetical protein [Bacillus sp. 1NLA3E]|uniref:hypothetical protein n=1 Tax=Bacillus sp. 1NLA3E TaxID=666686 RepID=UPI000247E3DA|nr:hypothetical protein [Bacillus sp. 1NLA3E]AGK53181.1 hypothetical protein B1NLA3E_07085 [Bacillus sp. 1NLA3E]
MDEKLKHLEFIQQAITRMASNSFMLKGWTVTLVVGLFAFANIKEMDSKFILLAFIPAIFFWILDGYFIQQEKKYRDLYKEVSAKQYHQIDFSMDASVFKWYLLLAIFSPTLVLFYVPILFIIVIALKYLPIL